MSITVHVIGHGAGESIVLELPDGSVGVVDHFLIGSGREARSPAGGLIRRLGATALRFIAVTHPHADHCRGIVYYLVPPFETTTGCPPGRGVGCDAAGCLVPPFEKVDAFWVFDAIDLEELRNCLDELAKLGTHEAIEGKLGLPSGTMSLEVMRLCSYLKRARKAGLSHTKRIRINGEFSLCEDVSARFLTPTDGYPDKYSEQLRKRMASGASSIDHNLACGAILISYNKKTHLLLLADAEASLWRDFRETTRRENMDPLPKVQFIKASHHGSENGCDEGLYEEVCTRDTLVVVTPFTVQGLPSQEGIERIAGYTRDVLCTNGASASKTSGKDWETTGTPPRGRVPREWVSELLGDPERAEVLASRVAGTRRAAGEKPVPREWVYDCLAHPEWLDGLRTDLRDLYVKDPRRLIEDEFRVSVTYDEHGSELDRKLGRGAGRLVVPGPSPGRSGASGT